MRSSLVPADAARLFAGMSARWWVAGGWAIDLWLGRTTRHHADLDIAILRSEQVIVRAHLEGWDLHLAHQGELTPLKAGDRVEPPLHAIWCRRHADDAWAFELLMNDASGDEWLFRRDHAVRRLIEELGSADHDGIPFLSPEVVLLFKAKKRRNHDEADFSSALPALEVQQRRWLRRAIQKVHPGHEWVERLDEA